MTLGARSARQVGQPVDAEIGGGGAAIVVGEIAATGLGVARPGVMMVLTFATSPGVQEVASLSSL